MPLVTSEVNAMVDFVASRAKAVSVHTADPGSTGASEATGGSYGRKSLAFAAASGTDASAAEVPVDVPAGSYTHYGLWSATTGGTFLGGGPLLNGAGNAETATFSSAGQIKVTVVLDGSSAA